MVAAQLRARAISDERILSAFGRLPREQFMPPDRISEAYADHPVPIGFGQTISQPFIVALMIQELDLRADHRVLDVGAGSGYQSAVLASVAAEGHIFAVERIEALARRAGETLGSLGITNVTIATLDGSEGWPDHAPYDRIICGAAAPDVPRPWIDQLANGGRIILPAGGQDRQTLLAIDKRRGRTVRRKICDVRFVKLIGAHGWQDRES